MGKWKIKAEGFIATQVEIDTMKNNFLNDCVQGYSSFVYYRKGEWHGKTPHINHLKLLANTNPNIIFSARSLSPILENVIEKLVIIFTGIGIEYIRKFLKEKFSKSDDGHNIVTIRVICSEENFSEEEREWIESISDMKNSVQTIPKEQVGIFRYFVNEKRYAIFCRVDANNLEGIIGYDRKTISLLREKFNEEFLAAAVRNATKSR